MTTRGTTIASRLLVAAAVAALVGAMRGNAYAAICSAGGFGCPATGTCIITGTWEISPGCVLDFGTKDVEVKGTIKSSSVGGSFSIRSHQFTLGGGKLKSLGNSTIRGGNIALTVDGAFRTSGDGPRIDTSGNGGGGDVSIAAGSIDLPSGTITADGGVGDACGDGGRITLAASGAFSSSVPIRSSTGGRGCNGGSIAITGAGVTIGGDLDAHGGAAAAEDAIVITATAGDLVLLSSSTLNADGTGQPEGTGADAGNIALVATAGDLVVGAPTVSLNGNSPDGSGGELKLSAHGALESSARILARGGVAGTGGSVDVAAGEGVAIVGDLSVAGGSSSEGEGGSIEVSAGGDVLLASLLDVSGAAAGSINASRALSLTLTGAIDADGTAGNGGDVSLTACTLQVSGGITSNAIGGSAGSIELAGGTVSIASTAMLAASVCPPGTSCIALTGETAPPAVFPGASIVPAPTLSVSSVGACSSL